jgi:hypothetical protein
MATLEEVCKIPGMETIVSMVNVRDEVLVATKNSVYLLRKDYLTESYDIKKIDDAVEDGE